MALNFKKILALSGGIAATVATGGVGIALLAPALGLASEFIPGEDAEKIAAEADLDGWERVMILGWVETYKRFMGTPMSPEMRERTFEGKLRSDFIMNYADMPDDKWIDAVHQMISVAVSGMIAASSEKA
jgi:hypothetical protein